MRTVLADLPAWLDAVDLGDLPTWLGAGGAIGSMGVTIAALIYAKRAATATREMLRVETDRDRNRDQAEAQAQAQLVSGWYGQYRNSPGSSYVGPEKWGAFVRNASPVPVYDFRAEFFFRGRDGSVTGLRGSVDHGTLPPTGDDPVFIQASPDMLRQVTSRDPYVVALTFRDSVGQRWRREHDGMLSDLT